MKPLCWLFALVYRLWLWDEWHQTHARVIRVKGRRTALIDCKGQRRTMTPCFLWFD